MSMIHHYGMLFLHYFPLSFFQCRIRNYVIFDYFTNIKEKIISQPQETFAKKIRKNILALSLNLDVNLAKIMLEQIERCDS